MSNHRVLILVLQNRAQVWNCSKVAGLSETVRDLVLEERGWGGEGRGDGFDSWEGLWGGVALRGEMLEGEESAKADGERGGFASDAFAESCNGRIRHGDGNMRMR